jgi:hypothetical protein
LDIVTHGRLAIRGFIVVLNLIDILGSIPIIIVLDETEPITRVASHLADLRRYEPIHGRPSGETAVDD